MGDTIGLSTCECKGTGRRLNEMGLYETCPCVQQKKDIEKASKSIKEPVIKVVKAVKEQLVEEGIITQDRIDDDWDEFVLRSNVDIMTGRARGKIGFTVNENNLSKYIKCLSGILSTLRFGERVKSSYLIGASNGFGKNTFATTAIKLCRQNGYKVVPYMSLLEIAEIKKNMTSKYWIGDFIKEYEDIDRGSYRGENEEDEDEAKELSKWQYKDFVNAELLITYLADAEVDAATIEMFTLQSLLRERSAKGKATIVMLETGLQWYWNKPIIKKHVLNEILAPVGMQKLDRLEYTSVYLE